jgi:hypothetical protein
VALEYFSGVSVPSQRGERLQTTLQQLGEIREELEQRQRTDRDRRRAEDRFRDQHHDAHAKTILCPMRIRVIKTPPAPLMDGVDVRNFHADHVYTVDDGRIANYLIRAGYAIPYDDVHEPTDRQKVD